MLIITMKLCSDGLESRFLRSYIFLNHTGCEVIWRARQFVCDKAKWPVSMDYSLSLASTCIVCLGTRPHVCGGLVALVCVHVLNNMSGTAHLSSQQAVGLIGTTALINPQLPPHVRKCILRVTCTLLHITRARNSRNIFFPGTWATCKGSQENDNDMDYTTYGVFVMYKLVIG